MAGHPPFRRNEATLGRGFVRLYSREQGPQSKSPLPTPDKAASKDVLGERLG